MARRLIYALLATLLLWTWLVPMALAADVRGGNAVTIGADEVINDDLYVAGGTVTINGTVNGDVFASGGTVTFSGKATGSVHLAGGTVTLGGEVGKSARVAGGNVVVTATIAEDLLVGTGNLDLSRGTVGRDLLLGAGNAALTGSVGRRVWGGGGTVTLNGSIGQAVRLEVDELTVTRQAKIGGNLTYISAKEAQIEEGAQIAGTVTREEPPEGRRRAMQAPATLADRLFGGVRGALIAWLMAAIYGVVLLFALPQISVGATNRLVERPWPSLGLGIVLLIVVPVVAALVLFTIVGIPLALIALLTWAISLYTAQVFVGMGLGRWFLGLFGGGDSRVVQFFGLLLGLLVIYALSLVPYVGPWVHLVVILFGLGALGLTIMSTRGRPPAPARFDGGLEGT